MIEDMRQRLKGDELTIAEPLFDLDEESIDGARSGLVESEGFLKCRFAAKDDIHCPFEIHFGRGEHDGRFNFFIGRGAEMASYEPLTNPEELAGDVRSFLTSAIIAEGESKDDVALKEEYTGSNLTLEGRPLRFFFVRGGAEPRTGGTKHRREYTAWIRAGST
jgi:hypothetical protein